MEDMIDERVRYAEVKKARMLQWAGRDFLLLGIDSVPTRGQKLSLSGVTGISSIGVLRPRPST